MPRLTRLLVAAAALLAAGAAPAAAEIIPQQSIAGVSVDKVNTIEVYKGRQELTATGIGIRSHRDKVKAEVAGARCKRYDKTYAICTIGGGEIGDIQTTFWLNRRDKVKLVTLGRILYD